MYYLHKLSLLYPQVDFFRALNVFQYITFRAIAAAIPATYGRTLPINVSGAIPAVMLDAGFPLEALKGIPILARTAGLIGHLLEESRRSIGIALSEAARAAIVYDGARA